MNMKIVFFAAALAANTLLAQRPNNLLLDGSFENGFMDTPFSTNWITFGNVFCESENPRTGIFAAKMYGNFKTEPTWSGIYQDRPAQPGKFYEATGFFKQISKDHLKGENVGWLKLEFYDREGQQVAAFESQSRLDAKSPSNKFVFLSTGRAASPPGTVSARVVAIFAQGTDMALGAVWVDDLSLREIQ